jgi:hypothetical protein
VNHDGVSQDAAMICTSRTGHVGRTIFGDAWRAKRAGTPRFVLGWHTTSGREYQKLCRGVHPVLTRNLWGHNPACSPLHHGHHQSVRPARIELAPAAYRAAARPSCYGRMVPAAGIEPAACSVWRNRSSSELRGRGRGDWDRTSHEQLVTLLHHPGELAPTRVGWNRTSRGRLKAAIPTRGSRL